MPMEYVLYGTVRDAAAVAFATIFGGVKSHVPVIRALVIEHASPGIVLPPSMPGRAGGERRRGDDLGHPDRVRPTPQSESQ
jgi:hypothetical protein